MGHSAAQEKPFDVKLIIGIAVLFTFLVGFNVGNDFGSKNSKYLWDSDRDGLRMLNKNMKSDKSERLAAVFITKETQYLTTSLDLEKVYINLEIKPVPKEKLEERWKEIHGVKL